MESHQRYLPHYYPTGVPIFVTFRTKDSLSPELNAEVSTRYQKEKREIEKYDPSIRIASLKELNKKYFYLLDSYCDSNNDEGINLANYASSTLIKQSILYYPDDVVRVFCFTIMRNHVHLLIMFPQGAPLFNGKVLNLPDYIHNVKGFTGKKINEVEKSKGNLWMREYYDVVIRSDEHMCRTIHYILMNPVKVGICKNFHETENNYWNEGLIKSYTGFEVRELIRYYSSDQLF